MAKDKAKASESAAKVAADSAPKAAAAPAAPEYDYVVRQRFSDINDGEKPAKDRRYYEVDSTVNQFGETRLNGLIARGLVERRAK